MPGAFKLKPLTFIHSHKPYKFLIHFPSFATSTTAVATLQSRTILGLKPFPAWWRMTTPCLLSPRSKFTQQILRRQRPCFLTSDSGTRGQDGQCDRNLNANSGTRMSAAVNGNTENKPDMSQKPNPSVKLLTLPTILTIGRVVAIPILIGAFYAESWWGPTATTGIFIAAAITDWLDGYLARKMNLGTPFGAFLDPVADKLMVAATLILLCTKPFAAGMFGEAPWLLTVPAIAIIGREITMSAVREWAASQDRKLLEAVAVNNLGKWKTATQMSALTILLAARDDSLVGAGTLVSSGVVLLYISAWLALWSLVVYMRKIWKVLLR